MGGGAAGIFTALNVADRMPSAEITVLEKSSKLLSKVKVSGGGRCNVTNGRTKAAELIHFYPRGHKKLYAMLNEFSPEHMQSWLQHRGVATKTEEDLRVFPTTDNSQTIIDCFLGEARRLGVRIVTKAAVHDIIPQGPRYRVLTDQAGYDADKIVIATGSSVSAWKMLEKLKLKMVPPVPSLFTFNITDHRLADLPGVSFPEVGVKVAGIKKLEDAGPLLITHWGLSGPAILKLSSWGAHELHKLDYQFTLMVNFLHPKKPEQVKKELLDYAKMHPKRSVLKYPLWDIPRRFWERITWEAGYTVDTCFGSMSKKQVNKLIEELCQGSYAVHGKSTFKEEFVTAGGIDLGALNLKNFESKQHKGLYLAGEVVNIDALTGGFNFQACWSAAWLIAKDIAEGAE